MLNIVLIGLAKKLPRQDEKHELHRLLRALLSKSLTQSGKLNIIEKEYDIPFRRRFKKEFFENPKTDRLRKFLQTFTYGSGEDKNRTY